MLKIEDGGHGLEEIRPRRTRAFISARKRYRKVVSSTFG